MPIKLNGSTSGYTQVNAAAVAANNTLVLPTTGTTLLSDTFTGNVALTGNATITGNETVSGNVTVSGDLIPSSSFLRNRIINGNMQIWQRGTSATLASLGYLADRWALGQFVSTQGSQSTSVPAGFQYSLKVQRPSGATSTTAIVSTQCIESVNCYDLSSQSVTLSFWAKAGANFSAASSTLLVQVYTGTAADQGTSYPYYSWTGVATPISINQTITTTWTRYTVTGTFGAGVLEAMALFTYTPVGTAGADDAFYITGVQLEVGSNATPFERRQYGQELLLCQRYFQISAQGYPTGTSTGSYSGVAGSTGYISGFNFPTVMRAVPTITFYFNGTINSFRRANNGATITFSNSSTFGANTNGGGVPVPTGNTFVIGDVYTFDFQATAEL